MDPANLMPAPSPEPLGLLVATVPSRALLELLKADDALLRAVFQGFTVKEQTLTLPPVRQRLEREATRQPEFAGALWRLWRQAFQPLMDELDDPAFTPDLPVLAALVAHYGEMAVRYGLLHAEREDLHAWTDRLTELPAPPRTAPATPDAPPRPSAPAPVEQGEVIAALRKDLGEAQYRLRETERINEHTQRELAQQERLLKHAAEMEASLRKLLEAADEKLEREQRRAKKAEERADFLQKQTRKLELELAARPTLPAKAEPTAPALRTVVSQVITLLQQGLEQAQHEPISVVKSPAPAAAAPAPAVPAVFPSPVLTGPAITVPVGRRQQTFTVAQILTALVRNDVNLIDLIRDGLARLSYEPEREHEVLRVLSEADVPTAIMAGPIRAAVVDGSNVANMSPERRGRLAYLQQVRRSAWHEGYFPVVIIVDASLRHQIDTPEGLMELVDSGEVTMAPPGTSADVLLIEEAAARQAVLLTNDRMHNWPAAKTLEKRHVELHRGAARVGAFHRTGLLPFSW